MSWPALIAGVAVALYLRAALRLRWPLRRTAAWIAGAAALALAPAFGGSLPGHMVEHAVLVAVAAPLLVAAMPLVLAARALGQPGRRRLLRLIRSRPAAALAHPAFVWPAFVAAMWVAHLPGVIAALDSSTALHDAEHLALLAVAVLFWTPVLGGAAAPHPLRGGARCLYVFLAAPAADLAAVALMVAGEPAAGTAMLAGTLPIGLIAAVLAWRWATLEERRAARRQAAGAEAG